MKSHEIPMKSLWNPMIFHEFPWFSMIFHEFPRAFWVHFPFHAQAPGCAGAPGVRLAQRGAISQRRGGGEGLGVPGSARSGGWDLGYCD
jgi:hypothetical protein